MSCPEFTNENMTKESNIMDSSMLHYILKMSIMSLVWMAGPSQKCVHIYE